MSALRELKQLPHAPASDVKKLGWRGMMRTLQREGAVVVTNHNSPEAVLLSIEAYTALQRGAEQGAARMAAELDALRQRFDARLSALQADDAGERLRAVFNRPAASGGNLKVKPRA
jgi:prevent-host-death family protein